MTGHTTDKPTLDELANDRYITSRQLRKRYGNVSDGTMYAWLKESNFPRPIVIRGRYYWSLRELAEYEATIKTEPSIASAA